MKLILILLCGVLAIILLLLTTRLILIKKSMKEIGDELTEFLSVDTNALITTTSRDKQVRALAETLNQQLVVFQKERQRYTQGDLELKNAVTNISHDLRTPLTAIYGYLELLKQEEAAEKRQQYLELIENRTRVMKQLTEELFRYSVILSTENTGTVDTKQEVLVLNEVMEESIACYYAAFREAGITPVIQLTEERLERKLNRSALSRILGNIISNALKYSDGDFSVTLDDTGTMRFCNHASNLNTVMAGKLFDRFYTVETGSSSTGLGLSIAKNLTEQMGGTITAEYVEGQLRIGLAFPAGSSEAGAQINQSGKHLHKEEQGRDRVLSSYDSTSNSSGL